MIGLQETRRRSTRVNKSMLNQTAQQFLLPCPDINLRVAKVKKLLTETSNLVKDSKVSKVSCTSCQNCACRNPLTTPEVPAPGQLSPAMDCLLKSFESFQNMQRQQFISYMTFVANSLNQGQNDSLNYKVLQNFQSCELVEGFIQRKDVSHSSVENPGITQNEVENPSCVALDGSKCFKVIDCNKLSILNIPKRANEDTLPSSVGPIICKEQQYSRSGRRLKAPSQYWTQSQQQKQTASGRDSKVRSKVQGENSNNHKGNPSRQLKGNQCNAPSHKRTKGQRKKAILNNHPSENESDSESNTPLARLMGKQPKMKPSKSKVLNNHPSENESDSESNTPLAGLIGKQPKMKPSKSKAVQNSSKHEASAELKKEIAGEKKSLRSKSSSSSITVAINENALPNPPRKSVRKRKHGGAAEEVPNKKSQRGRKCSSRQTKPTDTEFLCYFE